MAILLCHEMGHYVMCLRYRVPATLPYFIPFPLSLFGTMGAVIRMKGGIYGRKPLFDIGIAGPLAGLLVAVPVTFIGLTLSDVTPSGEIPSGTISLGEPILFRWLARLALGALPEDADTILHPLAFAGWAGFFVTALNLLPIGQLDGGHVTHALFPRRSLAIARIAFAGLALAAIRFPGWILLAALTLFMGLRHPPVASYEDLGRGRFWLGVISLILFALTFTPQPFGTFP
jgi:membrane-associated protease RseP (regulator of RpoE activity)